MLKIFAEAWSVPRFLRYKGGAIFVQGIWEGYHFNKLYLLEDKGLNLGADLPRTELK